MLVLRQAMAFPMFLTVAWLAWVLGQQGGPHAMATLLGLLVLLAGLVWAWQLRSRVRWVGVAVFGAALAGLGATGGRQLAATPALQAPISDAAWQPWSAERVQAARLVNEQLSSEVDDLKAGLGMVEERARMELGMVKPNEIFVQVSPR